MAKKPTAKQLAARKKFVAAVKAGKFRKGKKKPVRKKRVAKVRSAVKKVARKVRRAPASVASLKSRIKGKLDEQLKEQLFKRDKAASYKQHRSAQLKIDKIRRELRKIS